MPIWYYITLSTLDGTFIEGQRWFGPRYALEAAIAGIATAAMLCRAGTEDLYGQAFVLD
jgi:hypothetical protein